MAMRCDACKVTTQESVDRCPKCGGVMSFSLLADLPPEAPPADPYANNRQWDERKISQSAQWAEFDTAVSEFSHAIPGLREAHSGIGLLLLSIGCTLLAIVVVVVGLILNATKQGGDAALMVQYIYGGLVVLGTIAAVLGKIKFFPITHKIDGGPSIAGSVACDAFVIFLTLLSFVVPQPGLISIFSTGLSLVGFTLFMYFVQRLAGAVKHYNLAASAGTLICFIWFCVVMIPVGVIGAINGAVFAALAAARISGMMVLFAIFLLGIIPLLIIGAYVQYILIVIRARSVLNRLLEGVVAFVSKSPQHA